GDPRSGLKPDVDAADRLLARLAELPPLRGVARAARTRSRRRAERSGRRKKEGVARHPPQAQAQLTRHRACRRFVTRAIQRTILSGRASAQQRKDTHVAIYHG